MSSHDDEWIDLTDARFTRGMLADLEQRVVLREFSSYISDVEGMVNDGKEATVYRCRARPTLPDACGAPPELLAAKMYRARKFRAFATESQYLDSHYVRDRRMRKAIRGRTRKGKRAAHQLWIDREWDALNLLHDAGASVPKPYAHCGDGILMEYLGHGPTRAPALAELLLERADAERVFELLVRDLEILVQCGLVHGDLSAFNVLYLDEAPRVIDLPQAVRIEDAHDAWTLFHRDVDNLSRYFARHGLAVDRIALAIGIWQRR